MGGLAPIDSPNRARKNSKSDCKPFVGPWIQPAVSAPMVVVQAAIREGGSPLADIVDDAHSLAMNPLREYEVLAVFSAFTKRKDSMPAGWLVRLPFRNGSNPAALR